MSAQQPNDDEPTVIRTPSMMPATGNVTSAKTAQVTRAESPPSSSSDDTLALPIGTRLGEFELTHRIGEGGFGIVYKAWDHSLERPVAVKEYLPSSIATRVGQTRISARSERHRETFEAGLKSFINEAKLLARFDHPSLVKVFRFWEAHGTAYMVMPFYEGVTMRDTVRAMAQPPDEHWLMEMLASLTEALAVIHAEQCYHRDIAPDNVMLLHASGRPLLLDFGAARRVIGDMTQALTVILKPGYAPVEQYAEVPGMKQGPWTDVYALAAVVYWCITGKTPPPSVGRMLHDSWVPLAESAAGRYSPHFLEAIDRALTVRPEMRTQNIDVLREELGLPPAPRADPDVTVIRPPRTGTGGPTLPGRTATGAATAGPTPRDARTVPPARTTTPPAKTAPRPVTQAATATAQAESARPPRTALFVGLAAAVLAVGAGAWWLTRSPTAPAIPPAPPAVALPSQPEVKPPAATPAPPPAAPAPPPMVARSVPKSAAEAFAQWTAERSGALALTVRAPASVAADARAAARVSITASQPGYLYLVALREGANDLVLWHPNGLGASQRVDANVPVEFAPSAWADAAASTGVWRGIAIVSSQPWNLAADGWQVRGTQVIRSFATAMPAGTSPCPAGAGPCDAFGAEAFAVTLQPPEDKPPPTVQAKPPVRPPAATPTRPPERTEAKPANSEECARLLSQMSLGDASAALAARFRALGCR
jgi:serine/threonine protein kinase